MSNCTTKKIKSRVRFLFFLSNTERLENDGVARVEQECQQESDDDYYSIDWTDTEEEVEPIIQQGTEPSIQQEVEPITQENA